jgi:hypothetical protein
VTGLAVGAHTLYARQQVNGRDASAAAVVHYAVNAAPTAVDDAATTPRNTAVSVNVLANDSDPDGDALAVSAVTQAGNGSVTNDGAGQVTYRPSSTFVGTDSFTYTLRDSHGATASATVRITVIQVNHAPVAGNDNYSTAQDTALTVPAPGVLGNDTDADADPLSASLVAAPQHGQLTLAANGSITYTPAPGYSGADAFTYAASDGQASSNTATVSLTITPAAQTTGKVTAAGEIAVTGGTASFGMSIKRTVAGGPVTGQLTFDIPARNLTVSSTGISSLTVSGSTARFSGTCTKNASTPCTFAVTVQDFGEPGKGRDTIDVLVSDEPRAQGALTTGNVKIH